MQELLQARSVSGNKKKTNPPADKIMDICAALEVTPEELLTGSGIEEEKGFVTALSKDRITPVDWQIINDFHGMKDEQKRRLLRYMEVLKNRCVMLWTN